MAPQAAEIELRPDRKTTQRPRDLPFELEAQAESGHTHRLK